MERKIVFILSAFMVLFIMAIKVHAGTVDLPQTGQTKCYDTAGTEIPCAGTGQDGDIQAGVPWPEPRFTDNGDQTMTDNLTGLMWTKDAGMPTVGSCTGGAKTWQGALHYVACLNSINYLGHSDWVLPNINELENLSNGDAEDLDVWLNTQGFINVDNFVYWSSTTYAYPLPDMTPQALGFIMFYYGLVSYFDKMTTVGYDVWPVRSGDPNAPAQVWKTGQTISYAAGDDGALQRGVSWPEPRFTDHGDGTVTDNLTGLMWTKDAKSTGPSVCFPGIRRMWQGALRHAQCLNDNSYLGYTDWRLPNQKELRSLIDYSQYRFALPADHPFLQLQPIPSWTSTTSAGDASHAWIVDMKEGLLTLAWKAKFYNSFYIWPVRSGPGQ